MPFVGCFEDIRDGNSKEVRRSIHSQMITGINGDLR